MLGFEFLGHILDDAVVPIFTSQADVAFDAERFEAARRQANEGNVERAAAEIVNQHGLRRDRQRLAGGEVWPRNAASLKTISQRGGRRLVENIKHVEPGDAAGVFGRLAARVVEIGGHGNDRFTYRPNAAFGILDQFFKNDRR